jgi:signal transduction histidine kinase
MIRTQPSLSRDFALLSVFIVFLFIVASAWVAVQTVRGYSDEVRKQMENEALRLDRALIVEIENASYVIESIGRQIEAGGSENEDKIAQLFFSFAKNEGGKKSVFSWINKAQMVSVSNNLGVLPKPIDVSDRDYIKKAIADPWKVHVGRPIEGRTSRKWVLPLSLGLTDKSGAFIGAVVISLDTENLVDAIGRTLKDSGVRFAITNTALTLLTQTTAAEEFFTHNFDVARLSKIDFDKTTSGEYSRGSLFDKIHLYSYFERSSQYPYIIFLGLDPVRSHEAVMDLLMPRLLQLSILAIFLLSVLWTLRKRIIQPVIALTEQASHVARGNKTTIDYVAGPGEIEHLAHEIKRLCDYIEERRRVESELRLKNTELTRIKEAAQLTNQVKADFFAYVGQELSEPASAILAQSETLKVHSPAAQDIYQQATQLLAMLDDIKAISKAETGLLAIQEAEIDLMFVLQKSIRIFRERQTTGVEVQLDVMQLPHVKGDELRIKQLVLNVLNAASHQLAPSETIRITSSTKTQELSLIFSYSSAAGTHATRSKHGLEIALARLLVAMHQGTLDMKTGNDRVTMITVKFPAIRVL